MYVCAALLFPERTRTLRKEKVVNTLPHSLATQRAMLMAGHSWCFGCVVGGWSWLIWLALALGGSYVVFLSPMHLGVFLSSLNVHTCLSHPKWCLMGGFSALG